MSFKKVENNGMNLLAGGCRTQSFSLNAFPIRFITLPCTHTIIADRDALKVDKKIKYFFMQNVA